MRCSCALMAVGLVLGGGLRPGCGLYAEEAERATPPSAVTGSAEKGNAVAATAGEKGGRSEAFTAYSREAGRKLKRAATNLARAGTEFYVQPREARLESGQSVSMIWPGLGEAVGMFLTRVLGGAIEGATFAVPFPSGWNPLLEE